MTERRGVAHWLGLAIGGGVIVYGAVGLVGHLSGAALQQVITWMVAADVLHDFVVAPVVCLVGVAAVRWTPSVWRWPIRAGLITTTVVVAFAYPALRGFGRRHAPDNHSILPLDYPRTVATVLGVVWVLVLIWGFVGRHRAGRLPQSASPSYRSVTDV